MSEWTQNYIAALQARDAREKAHKQYIDAYTRLADRQASDAAAAIVTAATPKSPRPAEQLADVQPQQKTSILSGPIRIASRSTPPPPSSSPIPDDQQASLRADLASTQKARAALAATLKDVELQLAQLQAERKEQTTQIAVLSRAKLEAERRLRDRDSEIKGKASFVDKVQDEMVSLEMQLNLAEEKSERLTRENKDLVDRWMRKMGEEAERVNKESRWT